MHRRRLLSLLACLPGLSLLRPQQPEPPCTCAETGVDVFQILTAEEIHGIRYWLEHPAWELAPRPTGVFPQCPSWQIIHIECPE